MAGEVATFRSADTFYVSDTCEALKDGVRRGDVHLSALARGAYPGTPFPSADLPEVRTVGYWNARHDQGWGLDWHRNEGIELTHIDRGKVIFGVDGVHRCLSSGDLTITRPWQRHRLGTPHVTACRLHWLILDVGVRRPNQAWRWPEWLLMSKQEREYLTTILRHNEQPVWRANEEIGFFFQRMSEVVDQYDDTDGMSKLKLYANGLFIELAALMREQNPALTPSLSSTQRTVELFLSSLSERVGHEWTVDAMAEACGLRRRRFSHYCQLITNMTPMEYLRKCRLEAARRLLVADADCSITDIAYEVGFSSSQYFSTVFYHHTGMTPREFRRMSPAEGLSEN